MLVIVSDNIQKDTRKDIVQEEVQPGSKLQVKDKNENKSCLDFIERYWNIIKNLIDFLQLFFHFQNKNVSKFENSFNTQECLLF